MHGVSYLRREASRSEAGGWGHGECAGSTVPCIRWFTTASNRFPHFAKVSLSNSVTNHYAGVV
jgi:hypothetical protein